jgi:hypothetical protein
LAQHNRASVLLVESRILSSAADVLQMGGNMAEDRAESNY